MFPWVDPSYVYWGTASTGLTQGPGEEETEAQSKGASSALHPQSSFIISVLAEGV